MNAEQYLKEHRQEALKKIAKAIGKDDVQLFNVPFGATEVMFHIRDYGVMKFNPLINAEQWIECLVWYKEERSTWNQRDILTDFWNATVSRKALLIAILRMIGGWDEKEI